MNGLATRTLEGRVRHDGRTDGGCPQGRTGERLDARVPCVRVYVIGELRNNMTRLWMPWSQVQVRDDDDDAQGEERCCDALPEFGAEFFSDWIRSMSHHPIDYTDEHLPYEFRRPARDTDQAFPYARTVEAAGHWVRPRSGRREGLTRTSGSTGKGSTATSTRFWR